MKNKNFLYLPLNPLFFFPLLIFLAIALSFNCKKDVFLGLKREALASRLAAKDYSFFNNLKENNLPQEEIFTYAEGAGLGLGLAAKEYGRQDLASHFLELEVKRKQSPYALLAALELATAFNAAKEYAKTIKLLDSVLANFPQSPYRNKLLFRKIEALYWLNQDEEVLKEIKDGLNMPLQQLKEEFPEVYLFKAVAEVRLNKKGWEDTISDLFFSLPASSLHQRCYIWLAQQGKLTAFSDQKQAYFAAKASLGAEEYGKALSQLVALAGKLEPDWLKQTTFIADFTKAVLATSAQSRYATLLLDFMAKASAEIKLQLAESAGRIFYAAKDLSQAKDQYEYVLERTDDPLQKKRLTWRLLKIGLNQGASQALAMLKKLAPRWSGPEYYADLIDELITLLLNEKRYQDLLELNIGYKSYLPAFQRARLSYIAARLLSLNLVQLKDEKPQEKTKRLYQSILSDNPQGYYGMLANYFLSQPEAFSLNIQPSLKTQPESQASSQHSSSSDEELLLNLYLGFGLYSQAFDLLKSSLALFKATHLSYWAKALADYARPYESLRLIQTMRTQGVKTFTKEEYQLYFPRPYTELIKAQAEKYSLDETLLFALFRQESAFNHKAISPAGARGLAQLMPDTASWLAQQLKIKDYDLSDPSISILLGCHYLSFLKTRLSLIPYILAGYNAGPNVARRWQETYKNLPLDLAIEAFPYRETSDFVKNIFAFYVIYSLLYETQSLKDAVHVFFYF